MSLDAADRRGLRGLLLRVRALTRPPTHRQLITGYSSAGAPDLGKPTNDPLRTRRCAWCGDPTQGRGWHSDHGNGDTCLDWYFAAKGEVEMASPERRRRLNWATSRCVVCGSRNTEVDHALAICVARELFHADPASRWWLAWTPLNLRPLCHECHRLKTRQDRWLAKAIAAYRTRGIAAGEPPWISELRQGSLLEAAD